MLEQLFEIGAQYSWLAIFIAALLDSLLLVGMFIYGTALFAVCLFLLANGLTSYEEIYFFSFFGALLGDNIGYWIAAVFDNPLDSPIIRKRYPKAINKAKYYFEKYGFWAVPIGRFTGPMRTIMPPICSMLGMQYRAFLIANVLACAIWVGVWITVLAFTNNGVSHLISVN